jgi:hypothetical protein
MFWQQAKNILLQAIILKLLCEKELKKRERREKKKRMRYRERQKLPNYTIKQ